MSEKKRLRKDSRENKRRREESLENESLRANKRTSKKSIGKRNELLIKNEPASEDSVQNEPLAAAKAATAKAAAEEATSDCPADNTRTRRRAAAKATTAQAVAEEASSECSANGVSERAAAKATTAQAVAEEAASECSANGVSERAAAKATTAQAVAEEAASECSANGVSERAAAKAATAEAAAEKAAVMKETDDEEETGVTYPIDIWFLIADYIDPENVGKFARICKATLSVTDTGVFWVRLFKRYCRPTMHFQGRLKPGEVEDRFGFKCMVIKALHAVYKPFLVKTRMSRYKQHDILFRQVIAQWCEAIPSSPGCIFCFELRDIAHKRRLSQENGQEVVKDVLLNPLEGCVLLQITFPYMMEMPSLLGYILVDVIFVRLQNGFLNMKCTFNHVTRDNRLQIINVVFGPAICIGVFDWWHPHYPFDVPYVVAHYRSTFYRNIRLMKEKNAKRPQCSLMEL